MNDESRLMILTVPYNTMLAILMGKIRFADLDLPGDVRVVEVHQDWPRRAFGLMLHSAEFAQTDPATEPPRLPPMLMEQINDQS